MALVLAILGIICILYGVTVMAIWSGTWFFAFWYVLGAALLIAGWAVHAGMWEALPVVGKRVVEIALCVLLAGFLAAQACILKDFGSSGEPDLDYIVVLGAQVRQDGPSTVLSYRLDAAIEYLNANPNTICIVSGGQGLNEHTAEANVMADYLLAHGIAEDRIIREDQSRSTTENIANSMALFNPQEDRIGIVTNNFHVFRSLAIARKDGIAHICGIAAYSAPYYLPNNLAREFLGITKDFLTGNI